MSVWLKSVSKFAYHSKVYTEYKLPFFLQKRSRKYYGKYGHFDKAHKRPSPFLSVFFMLRLLRLWPCLKINPLFISE